jgi:hypothetical protein
MPAQVEDHARRGAGWRVEDLSALLGGDLLGRREEDGGNCLGIRRKPFFYGVANSEEIFENGVLFHVVGTFLEKPQTHTIVFCLAKVFTWNIEIEKYA